MLLAIAAVAVFNLNFNMNENNKLSSIALANIEALASSESGSGSSNSCATNVDYTFYYALNWCEITGSYRYYSYRVVATYKCTGRGGWFSSGQCQEGEFVRKYDSCNRSSDSDAFDLIRFLDC